MADVSIDSSISTSTARGMRSVVFPTADIGYWFYIDSSGSLAIQKTTDGGATWPTSFNTGANTTTIGFDLWFDQWTPGDAGTLIHYWWFDTTLDDVLYRSLDTNGDTLGTARVVFAGSTAVAGRGAFVSGTKTRSGYLYCAYDIDAGAEKGLHRSINGGGTWTANLSTTFVEATIDQCQLFPASNTGDNNDCWAVYHDASVDALTLKMWDSSAGSATESATIQAMIENITDLTGQYGFSASVRHSDGHLILASVSGRDTATADHQVWDINGTASITAKTAITTNIDDHYYPSVFIDQTNNSIYVAYNGKNDGSETLGTTTHIWYQKSIDGGSIWDAAVQYSEGSATAKIQTWAPLMGPRFYVGWRVGTTLVGNKVNSVAFAAGQTIAVAQVTETDLAQAIAWAPKARLVAQAVETDAAQAITARKTVAIGQALETDLAQAIARVKSRTLGQTTETDLAQPINRLKAKAIGQNSETDLAQAIARVKSRTLGQVAETDLAQAIAHLKRKPIGQNSETDLAQPINRLKAKPIGQNSETDLAQAIARVKSRTLGQTTETDLAQAVSRLKTRVLGQPSEADIAQTVTHVKLRAVAQVTETDLSQAIARAVSAQIVAVNQALETDAAQAISGRKLKLVGQVIETNAAQAMARTKMRSLGQALETDAAQAISRQKLKLVGQVIETNAAQAMVRTKTRSLGQALETDAAQPMLYIGPYVPSANEDTYYVPRESRSLVAARDFRTLYPPGEDRLLEIAA